MTFIRGHDVTHRFIVLLRVGVVGLCVASGAAAAPNPRATTPADTVLRNGAILTFDGIERGGATAGGARPARPRFARSLAIAGGRIVFIGDDRQAGRYVGPETRVIDLAGRMVMPGIVDGHFHGTRMTDCEMGYAGGTIAQILARLQACLDSPGQARFRSTNVQFSADHLFAEAIEPAGATLTRFDLDRLETTRPVLVSNADGHKFWMNSKAIGNAGLSASTPDQPGGEIGRLPDGTPNGFFADVEIGEWGAVAPVTDEDQVNLLRRTIADAHRAGITTVFVPGGGEEELPFWARIRDEGALTLRADVALSASFVRGNGDLADLRRRIGALEAHKRHAGGLLSVTSVKVYCDGVMEYPAHTGAMLHPYAVNAGTSDKPDWRPGTWRGPDPSCSDARSGFVELDRAGWRVHVHAIGDRATRDALDNFQAAARANGAHDRRHTITHLEAIDTADVPRFATLGVVASMSLQWARRDAYLVTGTVGYVSDALYARLMPAGDLWRAGAVIAGGSDYPVDPLLPFVQIETAIDHTGEAVPGVFPGPLSPGQTIPDLLAVIKMHTINSAYQIHQENEIGSLVAGKRADLVVLSQNLFEVPTERISETKVLLTIAGGRVVYDAAAEPSTAPPAAAAPAGGAPSADPPGVTLPPELARVLADYETAWSARDAAGLARLFAEDGFVLPNGAPPVRGRAAIERHYAGHGGPLALRAFEFATHGPVGYILGAYAPGRGLPDDGKFTLTLRRGADGRWLIVSDMDSGNRRRH